MTLKEAQEHYKTVLAEYEKVKGFVTEDMEAYLLDQGIRRGMSMTGEELEDMVEAQISVERERGLTAIANHLERSENELICQLTAIAMCDVMGKRDQIDYEQTAKRLRKDLVRLAMEIPTK